jgi:membrane associated rhomboid family serine protease
VRQPGPPRPGTYPPQGQPQAQAPQSGPTMGYRVRRWFAFLFAWSALLGAALGYAGRSQASGEFIRTQELAGALGLLFGVLTVAYLLLPASRQRRGRAIVARIIGLLAIAAAIGAGSEALPVGDATLFIESLPGPFAVLALSIFIYPKDRARPAVGQASGP